MTSPTKVTSKTSRNSADLDRANVSAELDEHPTQASMLTKSTLHVTPHYPSDRHAMLAEAAYSRAEQRGFEPGHELDDWFASEVELDQRLLSYGSVY